MKSITLHDVDDELARKIEARAEASGLSVNKTIKSILSEELGLGSSTRRQRKAEFEKLSGVWTGQDLQTFGEATGAFGKVDANDWKSASPD